MSITPKAIREALSLCYDPHEAAAMSRIVCCEMLGQSATDYYLGKDITLSANEEKKWPAILERLLQYEPLQYVQGIARFCGNDFHVAPGVLIPRPETAELVELVMKEGWKDACLLDIGTGSGCIAISLAKAMPQAEVTAWDISSEALAIARLNNERLQANVHFEECDVLTCQPNENEVYDVIISNPPYITQREQADMEENVLKWEPHQALFVPDDEPLLFYNRIAQLGRNLLKENGKIYFEINRAYGKEVVDMLKEKGYRSIQLLKDLYQNDRFVTAIK